MGGIAKTREIMSSLKEIRALIDEHFSIQWCRENVVVPLRVEPKLPPEESVLIIAVANFSYLGTNGEFINQSVSSKDLNCCFISLSSKEIENTLKEAERL